MYFFKFSLKEEREFEVQISWFKELKYLQQKGGKEG